MANRTKGGRPRVDAEFSVSKGIVVQPRFPRSIHEKMSAAATAEGLAITQWIRRVVCVALAKREEKNT